MSVKSLVWAWNLKIKVASHKLVLLTLADNANEQGECFPRIETIARRCGLKIRPLQKVIKKLITQGYLSIEPRHRKDGRQTTNIYYLSMEGKFKTIDQPDDVISQSIESQRRDFDDKRQNTPSPRTSPPCPVGHPHPVLQDTGPFEKSDNSTNENNDLQTAQNRQLSGLTNILTKDKDICASDDARAQNTSIHFDSFWELYPKKKDKIRALEIWKKKRYDTIATLIMEDVKNRTLNEAAWQTEQYIPHPSTYLKNQRWTDELTLQKIKPEKVHPVTAVFNDLKNDYMKMTPEERKAFDRFMN